jgi:hypothetical protein
MNNSFNDLDDGFYIVNGIFDQMCLVKLYRNPDTNQRGIGFGIWDGSGFIPLTDLSPETKLDRVDISIMGTSISHSVL